MSTLICTSAPRSARTTGTTRRSSSSTATGSAPRAGRLAADVEDVGALGDQRARVLDGAVEGEPLAAVGERVGRDVEDAHDARAHRALIVGPRALNRPAAGADDRVDGLERHMALPDRARSRPPAGHGGAHRAPARADVRRARRRDGLDDPVDRLVADDPAHAAAGHLAALRPRIARSARPEYVVAATVVSSQRAPRRRHRAQRRAAESRYRADAAAAGHPAGALLGARRVDRAGPSPSWCCSARPGRRRPSRLRARPRLRRRRPVRRRRAHRLRAVPDEQRDAPALLGHPRPAHRDCSTARRSRLASRRSPSRPAQTGESVCVLVLRPRPLQGGQRPLRPRARRRRAQGRRVRAAQAAALVRADLPPRRRGVPRSCWPGRRWARAATWPSARASPCPRRARASCR